MTLRRGLGRFGVRGGLEVQAETAERWLLRVRIVVTVRGFEPSNVTVPRGTPVILTFERQTNRTCATVPVDRDVLWADAAVITLGPRD